VNITKFHWAAIFAAIAIAVIFGFPSHFSKPNTVTTHSAVAQPVDQDEARLSAALWFSNIARRHLGQTTLVTQWSKVLVSEDSKTVCLEYRLGMQSETGVMILSSGQASQKQDDWLLKCFNNMYNLTAELTSLEAARALAVKPLP
jgi:hypothetical protein